MMIQVSRLYEPEPSPIVSTFFIQDVKTCLANEQNEKSSSQVSYPETCPLAPTHEHLLCQVALR